MPTITDANVLLGYINPQPSGRRRAQAQCREGARGVRREDRQAARHADRAGGLRRAPDRRLQHDPRHQGGVDRARPRPARVRAVRLRRQRPAVRRRHGGGARHRAASWCRRRPGCSPRSGCSMRTSSITTRARSAACCGRPTSAEIGARLGRARAAGERAARRRGLHRRARAAQALGGAALQGPELRADRAGAGRPDRCRHGRASRGGVRRRARADLRPSRRPRGAGRAGGDPARRRRPARGRRRAAERRVEPAEPCGAAARTAYFGAEHGWLETPVLAPRRSEPCGARVR